MKKWVISGLALLVLALFGGTFPYWSPWMTEAQTSVLIQTLADFIQILSAFMAITGSVLSYLGFRQMQQRSGSPLVSGLPYPVPGPPIPPQPPPVDKPVQVKEEILRRRYLTRLIAQAGHLSLADVDPAVPQDDPAARLELNAVYTALLTRSPDPEEELPDIEQIAETWEQPARSFPDAAVRPRGLSALAELNEHERVVLLGDAGSGKSTFLNFVAICLAGEILQDAKLNLDLLTRPLPPEGESRAGRPSEPRQPWIRGPLMPVRVELRKLAAQGLPQPGEKAAAQHLWRFIERDLAAAELGDYAPFLRNELLEKGGLLLLDGLDEIPDTQHPQEQIRRMVEGFVQSFGACRVLLTSRTYAYRNLSWRLPGFVEVELAPFSEGQIRVFIERWYGHLAHLKLWDKSSTAQRTARLQREILASDRLRGLAKRPLLLTLMASLHASRGELPVHRGRLYDGVVELLLKLWERRHPDERGQSPVLQPSLAELLDVEGEEIRRALEGLAFTAHSDQPDAKGTADISEQAVVACLLGLSRRNLHPVTIVEYLCNRAGLLECRGAKVYRFPHRTFQEYLAACHLTREGFPDTIADLARRDPGRWREVVLLAGAKATLGVASNVWPLAEGLCWRSAEDPECTSADVWGAHLAGQMIAESADLRQLSGPNRGKLERLREWQVRLLQEPRLEPAERARAGRTLTRLTDPRFDPDLCYLARDPLLGFIEISAGSVLLGRDKDQTPSAYDDETPRHEVALPTYLIGRFPVTAEQFRFFMKASVYEMRDRDVQVGLSNHPAVQVSWNDAIAYCRWLDQHLRTLADARVREGRLPAGGEALWRSLAAGRWRVTLPSEPEWEKAARGADGRIYPWSGDTEPDRANYNASGILEPSAVGCFPRGASPSGCEDMAGNVWEWTRSLYKSYPYPSDEEERRQQEDVSAAGGRVMRGGSFLDEPFSLRCTQRNWSSQMHRSGNLGFRLALTPVSPHL